MQFQIGHFAAQLTQMKPQIEAVGFFHVGKHLFPPVTEMCIGFERI